MALIRHSDKSTPLADAIVYRLGDLVREGNMLREQTAREVEAMLAAARAERTRLISTARDEGFKQGREEGHREGFAKGSQEGREQAIASTAKELGSLLKGWNDSLSSFEADRDSLLLEARTEVLRLAAEIAKAVIKKEIEIRPEAVVRQADAALAIVVRPTSVRLSVHPGDRPLIQGALPNLLSRCANAKHIELHDDESLVRGSCIVRSAGGEIDAQIDVQIARIVEAVVPPRERAAASEIATSAPKASGGASGTSASAPAEPGESP